MIMMDSHLGTTLDTPRRLRWKLSGLGRGVRVESAIGVCCEGPASAEAEHSGHRKSDKGERTCSSCA